MAARRPRQTALEKYCVKVATGKIAACDKVKRLCKELLQEIRQPRKRSKWVYDPELAEKPVRFIEKFCKLPSGRIGQPFKLEEYEAAWIESIFGFVDKKTRLRRCREAFIEVARKNGKTSLVAAIELYMLVGDGEGAPQVYNAANSEPQAELGYKACIRMLKQSAALSRHVRKRADDVYCDLNMGYIMPLAANSSTLDGLDVHFAVIDEIHAARTREVYDLLKQGVAAREQPLIIQITTNGFVRNSIFDEQYAYAERWLDGKVKDERFIAWIYELDDRDEWEDEACWRKANPGLGTVKKTEYLRSQVKRAKEDPSYRVTVMTKDFDMPENASTAWLTFSEAVNKKVVDFGGLGLTYGICGFDFAETTDLTSAQLLCMRQDDDHIYERSMYWLPEASLAAYQDMGKERDMAPYQLWASRGLLRFVPGDRVSPMVLVEWLLEVRDNEGIYPFAIGYDPWHIIDSSARAGFEQMVGKGRSIPVRQGPQTLSMPMKQIRADYKANRIIDNHNPINEWCRMNVSVRTDINLNIQPEKRMLNPRNRIDGFMAEIDAYVVLQTLMEDYVNVI